MTSKARDIADLGSNDVLETSSTGVDVTGTVTADGLTVDGIASTDGILVQNPLSGSFYNANIEFRRDTTLAGAKIQTERNSTGGVGLSFNYTANNTAETSGTYSKAMQIANNGDVSFYEDTGTTAKMVWDASAESLGIGTTPSSALHVKAPLESTNGGIRLESADGTSYATIDCNNAGNLRFYQNGSARMRIDSSGNLLVGKTSDNTSLDGVKLANNGSTFVRSNATVMFVNLQAGSSGTLLQFRRINSDIGSISVSGSTVSYNTTSDERLKENIQDTTHTVDINDIQVREFDWKVDGSHQRYGFIAQELETVYPEAVHSPDEEDEMKSVDYSKLVPLLVKEIQTLKARIETLENN